MGKSLEEDLAEFLLGMRHRGTLSREYYRACFRLWAEIYGEMIAEKIRAKVKAGWEK